MIFYTKKEQGIDRWVLRHSRSRCEESSAEIPRAALSKENFNVEGSKDKCYDFCAAARYGTNESSSLWLYRGA